MSQFLERIVDFVSRLLAGGVFEIVLLVVLVVIALILVIIAIWIAWKLLILLGKASLWLAGALVGVTQRRSAARREARLAAPPEVATGWNSSPRISLRKALAEARRMTGPEALRVLVVAGDGVGDLCRSAGLIPPGPGTIGVAAGDDFILIDATRAPEKALRRLARALPWNRPVDAVAAIVDSESIPAATLTRTASFARATGMRLALHLVLSTPSRTSAWRVVESDSRSGQALCTQLADDTARIWLAGGARRGLEALSRAQAQHLPASIDRALAAVPSTSVDIASLSFGGAGLRGAVGQTTERTHPTAAPGMSMWIGVGVLTGGTALATLVAVTGIERTGALRAVVDSAQREANTSWLAEGFETVPSTSRVHRMAGLGTRLSSYSEFSPLAPMAFLTLDYSGPRRLGAAMLDTYVMRPLAVGLARRAQGDLTPSDEPREWLDNARRVGEWIAAWEGLADDPREVDIRRLLSDAFGDDEASWPEGTELALVLTHTKVPTLEEGGLDTDALTARARRNFISTMERWAGKVYTNGPVTRAARLVTHGSTGWRERYRALVELRRALLDPGQGWITAAEDRPDYGYEARVYGRSVGLSILGQTTAIEAKAAVSRIRIDARTAAAHFVVNEIGPLMVRSTTGAAGGGGGPSLTLSLKTQTWFAFLEKLHRSEFAQMPSPPATPVLGAVTVDSAAIANTRRSLQLFDQIAASLPADLPPSVTQGLLREVAAEVVTGATASVELALRPAAQVEYRNDLALRLARTEPALKGMEEIEDWLIARGAKTEADQVLEIRARVAETALESGRGVVAEEDPVGVYIDETADPDALVRRFERGVEHLRRLYKQYGAPYKDAAMLGARRVAFEWDAIGRDIDAYDRGDPNSALSALEGMIQAFARDPHAACTTKNATHASARDDYVARALRRFHAQRAAQCDRLAYERAKAAYDELVEYFTRQVVGLWPYTTDSAAREVPASTMRSLVARIEFAGDALARLDGRLVQILEDHRKFWTVHPDSVAVSFRMKWRIRRVQEQYAQHLIGIEIEGVSTDADGVHTWRYGSPIAVRLRLAKNSPYSFVGAVDDARSEWLHRGDGNGGLLRWFENLENGAWSIEAPIADQEGVRQQLRVSAQVTNPEGAPITVPDFRSAALVDREIELNGNSPAPQHETPPLFPPAAEIRTEASTTG